MRETLVLLAVIALMAGACGDDDSGAASSDGGDNGSGDTSSGGAVVDPQPPGQAAAVVDGHEFIFTEPGALDCLIADDAITFSFRIGDNEVTLGAGANRYDADWLGGIDLRIANPEGEDGPVGYFPDLATNGDAVAIDGDSVSYSGPMQKQAPNDGTNPAPVDVGNGTISVTCG